MVRVMVREPVHFRQDGQVPGLPGNSGNSDLPHLHFLVVTDDSRHYGVRGGGRAQVIGVFGSCARSEAHTDTDVDILVDFWEGADLFDLIELSQYLEEKIGRHVDLATPRALRPEIRDGVYQDIVYA